MTDFILPLPQSEAFERTCKLLNIPVKRFEDEEATCLVQSRKLPVIGTLNLVSRGPVSRAGTAQSEFLKRIRADIRGPLAVNAPQGAKAPGIKLVAGACLAILDLKSPDEMRSRLHQNWRNQLKKAENSPLRVIDQEIDSHKHKWFFDAEQAQQKARKYRSHPPEFILAYAAANKGQARLYTAMLEGEPAAAMLVLKHGLMATYQAGVTIETGRKLNAHNLILWTMMTDLQKRGVLQLDLGRADLSHGLTRFKQRAGARIEQLPGTYLSLSRSWGRNHQRQLGAPDAPLPAT